MIKYLFYSCTEKGGDRGEAFGINQGGDSGLHLLELQNDNKAALPSSLSELGLESPLSAYMSLAMCLVKHFTNVKSLTIFQVPCQLGREIIWLLSHLNIKNIRQYFSKMCFPISNYIGTMVSLLRSESLL